MEFTTEELAAIESQLKLDLAAGVEEIRNGEDFLRPAKPSDTLDVIERVEARAARSIGPFGCLGFRKLVPPGCG